MRPRGFTLIELLAAMAVLAVLGALGLRGLNSILDAQARLQVESRRWNDVSMLFSQMSEDLALAIERASRDGADRARPALLLYGAAGEAKGADDARISLTRLGNGEGAIAQSAPRRVGYRLREGTLEYLVWPAPDSAPGDVPAAYPVLENVADLKFQALDFDNRWSSSWPDARSASSLPRAINVQVVLAGGAGINRILTLK